MCIICNRLAIALLPMRKLAKSFNGLISWSVENPR